MNILLTNDDGCDAPGLEAAFRALSGLGRVHVVAPAHEHSGCSHTLTLRRNIAVHRRSHAEFGTVFAVDGTPADCVRLALAELVTEPISLVISGINRGANAGVDHYYSGTVAAAREGAFFGIRSMAISQAVRRELEINWKETGRVARFVLDLLLNEPLPGPGFWSVNLPAPLPSEPAPSIHRVPIAVEAIPNAFTRHERDGGDLVEFGYGASYWDRPVSEPTDFSVLRDGGIAVSAVPLFVPFSGREAPH